MDEAEQNSLVSIVVLASLADGTQVQAERAEIAAIIAGLSVGLPEGATRERLPEIVAGLRSPQSRQEAYDTAVSVCRADGVLSKPERDFLADLARELGLSRSETQASEKTADTLVDSALAPGAAGLDAGVNALISRTALLCGALELLPQGMASLAILPLQMRMVYSIGKLHGFELDRNHVKEFLVTVGLGLTAQYLEGFARRLVGGLAGRIGGGFLRGLSGSATGAAFTYATTYALGQVARRYYAGGRKLSAAELKQTFGALFESAQLQGERRVPEMHARAAGLDVPSLLALVKGN